MALYLEFEGQPHGPPVPQPKRESYVEGVAEELLNGLFCHYEPPADLEPLPPSGRYPPRSPGGTGGTTPNSLQRGILLTPKVITPRPNHGRSVKWIDSKERLAMQVGDTRMSKVLTGRSDTAKGGTRFGGRNPFIRPNPNDSASAQNVRQDNRRTATDARSDKKGSRDQSSVGGERDEPPRRDPPGLEADILRNLRKKRDPALSARERKLSMQQRKAQLNLAVLDINHSDSLSAAQQGVLFDDEGYPISEVSDESSYYPNRIQKARPNEKRGLIRFRPPTKSIPGKDPPTNIQGESPRRQGQEAGPSSNGQLTPSNQGGRPNALTIPEVAPKDLEEAAMNIVRSPSPDGYSSTLCGFGPPVALKTDNVGRPSPYNMLDGCRPCESILLEPNEMKGEMEEDTLTLAPSEGNSAGLVFDGPADEIWMAGQDGRKIKKKWQLRRPKTMLGCGADNEHLLEPDSLLTPTRKYLWSRGRSFDSTDIQEASSWNVAENPSMQSDGSRPWSPKRTSRGRSTRARTPSPARVSSNGSYDEYKTPLQRLRSLGRRISPARSRSPGRSQSPARSRGRSDSPGPQQLPVGRRGRSESPFGRRGRSESPATRHKPTRGEQDKTRGRNKALFVNTTTTPQSSVFSNLTSGRFHSPATSRGTESLRSDGALVSGVGGSSYDDSRDLSLNNNHGRSRGNTPLRNGLPPKSPARVSHYGSHRATDEEREAPETTRSGLFGRFMRRNKDSSRGVQNDASWGIDSQSYTQDEYDH